MKIPKEEPVQDEGPSKKEPSDEIGQWTIDSSGLFCAPHDIGAGFDGLGHSPGSTVILVDKQRQLEQNLDQINPLGCMVSSGTPPSLPILYQLFWAAVMDLRCLVQSPAIEPV